MLFSEIYSPSSQQPQMSEEQMRQAKINRWGTDAVGPRDAFSEDYSDKFNTVLAPDEEEKYQAWATENHREKDVYDYDLRGAWKELQSGTMSEDERGHLGDKYKKPNHPTFSDQSIYSGQDGVTGGVWSRNADGRDVYTPGRKLSSVEADRLRRYFARNEPGVVLDLKDKVFEERPLPGVNTPLGIFSGLGDTWKGIPAALLQTTSSAITAFKNTGADILSRTGTDETRAWWEGQKAVMDQNARDIRDYNKVHFEVDPETMGTASQIVYGLFKTLPKAMGYGLAGGVAGGALAFGADVGIDETNRLMDEGVDRNTAINAGLVSFGMNAIGMRLPAVLGASRGMSAAYGAAANAGTNVAEVEGIKFILEHQDYNQLAQQYDLNGVDLAVSAVMGAAFGGAFWRSPEQIRTQKYQDAARLVYEDQRAALFNKGKSQFNFDQAGTQAAINARAVVSLAKRLGIEPDKVRDFSAKIVWSEDGKSAEVPKEAFNMPYTQGKEWHMGPTKASPDEQVTVVQYKGQAADRASAINEAAALAAKGLKNEETGFVLTASGSDLKKSIGGNYSFDERVFRAIAPVFDEVVAKARLFESTPDLKRHNQHVQGIHTFATPVEIDGNLYRVQLVVRDYITPKQERLATHKIAGIQIYEIENPPVSRTDGGPSDIRGVTAPNIRLSGSPVAPSDHVISLSQLAGGRKPYRRQDGKGLFDEVDKASRTEGGAYFESPSFNQIIGETGVRGMDAWDENWTRTNLLTVAKQMEMGGKTPEEIRAATGWERGADREWRYEIPDLNVKDGAAALVEEKRAAARKDGKKLFSVELADLVDAPDLFKAFSRFRNLKIEFGELPPRAGGYFAPEENAIRIPFDTDITTDGARMTLIHEIQHAIQEAEGFTKGADFSRVPTKGQALWRAMDELWRLRNNPDWQEYKDVDDALNRIYDEEATQARREKGITQAEDDAEADRLFKQVEALEKRPAVQAVLAEEKRLMKIYGSSEFDGVVLEAIKNASESPDDPLYESVSRWNPDFQMNAYRRVGGEVEARNAGRRAFMSPGDRAKKLLRDTEDVPRSEQTRNDEFYQVAYHGSPYLFDKFSLDHVGEGVRAQWYGWGMYFSLDKNVARQYASNLYNASGEARDRYNRLSAEAERLQHELSAAEESGDMAVADSLRAQWAEAKAAVDKALPDHPRVYDAEIPEDSVMVRAATTIDQQPEIVQQAFRNLLGDVDDSKKGRALYNELAKKFGSKKAASEALRNEGVLGLRYSNSMDGECAVVWDDKAIEIREFLQKTKENGEIRGSFNPQTNTIKLTPNANLSTFSHEHSHWYLTNLFAHAADENLSPEARADIDALLKAFGLKSVEEYNALPFERKVKLQEQYAAWTERYLAEGEVPAGYLKGMFRNFARWLMDMYRDLVGEGAGDDAAKKEIGERYKAQFGEELPELSKEVRRVLDRMYDAENKMASFRSNSGQVTAARVIQAQRTNNQKVTAPLQDGSAPNAYTAAIRAQQQAAQAMNSGEQVDVSQTMKNVPANDAAVRQAQNAFAKAFQMGDTGSIVVLQNRDRTGAVSVGQMNAIATAPDYTRLSVSRTTDSGAPIVSFGTLPDSQYLGNTETVADGSHKIPMTYAVVEADSVLRSNNFDGTPVPEYGTDPSRMHAIAGNGRMAGLSEAYNRGTAEQYRQDLMADAQSVGINPEVVAGMQHPVLVRIMPPEAVETGFIERSNSSNVLEKSALETAVQDSPRIRNNVWKYQFDEDGAPTPETVRQFTIDIGEPNALGKLLTADGRPTETATNRLRAAVFYEAYRDRTLTALVADDTDKQGIKRILNAMAAFAPHVINIREASNGAVDLGPILVDVVNRIRNAKIEGTPLESIIGQGDVFGDNPAVQQLLGFIAENQNSAAAIARVLEPFAAAVENRLKSSGNGPQAGLFGEAENVTTDLADVMGIFRDTQNRLIGEGNAAMREKGATEGFREALPAVDVMAMRNTLQAMQQAEKPAENVVKSVVGTVSEDAGVPSELPPDIPPDAGLDAEAKAAAELETHQAHELEGLSEENSERVQVEDLAALNPDFVYKFKDENGIEHQKTAAEILADEATIDKQADTDMAGLATAAMCIIRNNGIPA
nr:MAG TPA_asm: crystallin beta/gamma motif-containing protein [Caudoviricetes sp.]